MMDFTVVLGRAVGGLVSSVAGVVRFFAAPQLEIVPNETAGGNFAAAGEWAILVTVRIRNESERPAMLRTLELRYFDQWYPPTPQHPVDFSVQTAHGHIVIGLRRQDSVIESPQLPPMDVVKRYGVYRLAPPAGADDISITVRAVFVRRKSRTVRFRLRASGSNAIP
jgi:hypothetical protein